jgi:hypothetical protein
MGKFMKMKIAWLEGARTGTFQKFTAGAILPKADPPAVISFLPKSLG